MSRNRKKKIRDEKSLKEKANAKRVKKRVSIYETCTKCKEKKPLYYDSELDLINHKNGMCKKCLDTPTSDNSIITD